MKAVTTTLVAGLFGVVLALGGCAADVSHDPGEPSVAADGLTAEPSTADETGGTDEGSGAAHTIGLKRIGQPNGNRQLGTQSEQPVPNPWTGGNSEQASQSPSLHGRSAPMHDVRSPQ